MRTKRHAWLISDLEYMEADILVAAARFTLDFPGAAEALRGAARQVAYARQLVQAVTP
ncbi:MAG: hypothetical protein ACRDHG_04675 [Anaerolineales bacterium]